jgi:hypothetical protein
MEALVAGAIVAHASESAGHGHAVHTRCENCDTELNGPFCHRCGQHDIDFHRSFGHMFLDALENFFHFDAKLFRNIVTLLFRPGRLTADFNGGKRASQMPPFRLYLFVSVLFFFIRFLGTQSEESGQLDVPPGSSGPAAGKQQAAVRAGMDEALGEIKQNAGDPRARERAARALRRLEETEVAGGNGNAATDRGEEPKPAETAAGTIAPGIGPRVTEKKNESALERYLRERGKYALDHQQEFKEAFVHALPKMLLFCLPFFALYLRVLFRKSGYVYLQQLVVALHFHTFVFLWWLVARGWFELIGLRSPSLAGLLGFLTGAWMFVYPFRMLRQLFGESWLRIIFKTGLLGAAYGLTLGCALLATAIAVFYLV